MEFFLENVLRRLRAGRKMYVLLFLEMAIGSLVLSISLNLMFTGEKQRREYEKQNMGRKIAITGTINVQSAKFPVGADTYEELQRRYDGKLSFALSNTAVNDLFLEKCGRIETVREYCMDDAFVEEVFGQTAGELDREHTVFVGDDAYEVLVQAGQEEETTRHYIIEELYIVDDRLFVNGEPAFEVKPVSEINKNQVQEIAEVWTEGTYPVSWAVIFPFSHAAQIEAQNENEEPSFYSQLLAGGVNGKAADFDLLNDVTAYLTEVNQYQIECGISNSYLQFEKEYASLQWLTGYWVWIGAATMLMVATGMIGTLLLFQYRRRKNTAVSYFCGSTKRRIYAEQLVEIGAVLLFGTGIGLAIGFAVIRQGVFSYLMEIEWFYAVIVILAGLAAAMSLVLMGLCFLYDRKYSYLMQAREG